MDIYELICIFFICQLKESRSNDIPEARSTPSTQILVSNLFSNKMIYGSLWKQWLLGAGNIQDELGESSGVFVKVLLSRVQLFATPWTAACQAPLSMEFSRQEYWSGLPFLSSGDLPDPGIQPRSPAAPALWADSLLPSHQGSPILHL